MTTTICIITLQYIHIIDIVTPHWSPVLRDRMYRGTECIAGQNVSRDRMYRSYALTWGESEADYLLLADEAFWHGETQQNKTYITYCFVVVAHVINDISKILFIEVCKYRSF